MERKDRTNVIFNCSRDVQIFFPHPSMAIQEPFNEFVYPSCVNILYKTTNSEYGSLPPSSNSTPETFWPKTGFFSKEPPLPKCFKSINQ